MNLDYLISKFPKNHANGDVAQAEGRQRYGLDLLYQSGKKLTLRLVPYDGYSYAEFSSECADW